MKEEGLRAFLCIRECLAGPAGRGGGFRSEQHALEKVFKNDINITNRNEIRTVLQAAQTFVGRESIKPVSLNDLLSHALSHFRIHSHEVNDKGQETSGLQKNTKP